MTTATVYRLSEPVGVLRLDERGLSADPPDSPVLQGILASPLRDPETKAAVTAQSNPGRWLALLPTQYRSAYLWVGVSGGGP